MLGEFFLYVLRTVFLRNLRLRYFICNAIMQSPGNFFKNMRTTKIIISFSRYSDAELDNKAQAILNSVKGNKYFPEPTPAVSDLEAALKAYADALAAADDGGRLKIVQKNAARKVLEQSLRTLGAYVTMVAGGDREILASSGFDLSKDPGTTAPIEAPQGIEVILRTNPGEVEVRVNPLDNVRLYHFEYTPDPVTTASEWTEVTDTRRKRIISGLESGKKYSFRVGASGQYGSKTYSNVVSCMVL